MNTNSEKNKIRILGILEGLTLLGLLFVTMPLKYVYHLKTPNLILGMIHGFLFVIFIVLLFQIKEKENLSWGLFFKLFLCSVFPFGFLLAEWRGWWK
jgi:integral membrane protein